MLGGASPAVTGPPVSQNIQHPPGCGGPRFAALLNPFFSEVESAVPGLSMGRAGHCHHLLPAQRLPLLGDWSLARQAPTGFFVLLPKLEGQLDVPKHHRSTVLAHSSSAGCREPLLWWSRTRASQQQKVSIFFPLFPVDFTLASAATATPS